MKPGARRSIQAHLQSDFILRMVRLQGRQIMIYESNPTGHHLTLSDIQENIIQGTDVHLYNVLCPLLTCH
jgi:hypothetical protein